MLDIGHCVQWTHFCGCSSSVFDSSCPISSTCAAYSQHSSPLLLFLCLPSLPLSDLSVDTVLCAPPGRVSFFLFSEYPEWLFKLMIPDPSVAELERMYATEGLDLAQVRMLHCCYTAVMRVWSSSAMLQQHMATTIISCDVMWYDSSSHLHS